MPPSWLELLKHLYFWPCCEQLCSCHTSQSSSQSIECPTFSRPVLSSWGIMGGSPDSHSWATWGKSWMMLKTQFESQSSKFSGGLFEVLTQSYCRIQVRHFPAQGWVFSHGLEIRHPQWAIYFSSRLSYSVLCPVITAHLFSSLENGKGTGVCCCPKQTFLNFLSVDSFTKPTP